MNETLLRNLRLRTAEAAVGPSTVRGSKKGVARAARAALKTVQLRHFSVGSRAAFKRALDRETEAVRMALPRGARHWGTARKVLNIYLKQVVYNRHLRRRFKLARSEKWLEVPLDSHVAAGLLGTSWGGTLPRWKTIKGLSMDVHESYQDAAQKVASARGVCRVHLDYYWWRTG